MIEERGPDHTKRNIIEQTLTNAKSRLKFFREISEPLELGQACDKEMTSDLSSSTMSLKSGKKNSEHNIHEKPPILGLPKNNIHIPHTAFTDNLDILTKNQVIVIKQIEILKECAEKIGLQIPLNKTQVLCHTGDKIQIQMLY